MSGSREHNTSPGDRGQGIGGEERESRPRAALVGGPFISIGQAAERSAPEGCRLPRRIKISQSGFFILGNPNSLSPKKKREHNCAWRQRQHDSKKDRLNCGHRRPPGFANQHSHPERASRVFLVSIETRRLRTTTDERQKEKTLKNNETRGGLHSRSAQVGCEMR